MSVPEYARNIGRIRVITAAYNNCKHTIKVCKSEKNFPKRDRWILTNNIVNEAESILQCCLMANNINVKCRSDYEDRRQLQMKAKGHAMNQLALMRLAFETLSLDLSEEYWISSVDDVLVFLKRWTDSDRKRYGKYLED